MRIAALAYGAVIALLVSIALWQGGLQGDDQAADDGWRRTAAGWERIELWAVPKKAEFLGPNYSHQVRQPDRRRWDIHPGLLAAGQLLAVAGAFYLGRCFAGGTRTRDATNGVSNSLNAAYARAESD